MYARPPPASGRELCSPERRALAPVRCARCYCLRACRREAADQSQTNKRHGGVHGEKEGGAGEEAEGWGEESRCGEESRTRSQASRGQEVREGAQTPGRAQGRDDEKADSPGEGSSHTPRSSGGGS